MPASGAYERHKPETTLLHALVRENLEAFLEHARAEYERPLPRYVEQELRAYLDCGILANGFSRAKCRGCGHDMVVAFSCKKRSACPSCGARRMCGTAAHLVDHVLPDVPVRQWVLSVPWPLRGILAARADALTALSRIFVDAIFARHRELAEMIGIAGPRCGAVTHVQRFGSMNLHPHLHVLVLDGTYTRGVAGAEPVFRHDDPPTREELEAIADRVRDRFLKWLRRRGLLRDDADDEAHPRAPTALEACMQQTLRLGTLGTVDDDGALAEPDPDEARFGHGKKGPFVGEKDGFSVHAGVVVHAGDLEARERLVRYCARPAVSLERLSLLNDGRVAYRIKRSSNGKGPSHRLMTPLEFMTRLAAIIAPPRHPLVRFHGVLAPHAKWRPDVVPRRAPNHADCPASKRASATDAARKLSAGDRARSGRAAREAISPPADAPAKNAPLPPLPDERGARLRAADARIPWAELLKRTYDVDALACSKCGGRLRFIAVIMDKAVAREILAAMGEEPDRPVIARARAPTWGDGADPPSAWDA
jgi:hypothetical protein